MSQLTPQQNYRLDLDNDNDLDRSVQEQEASGYKRDSGIEQLNFEGQEYQHEPHQHSIQNSGQFMRDSQFSQQGVFSYNDDYRMRQSMKSEEDFELEDVSGNADMTDRSNHKKGKQEGDNEKRDYNRKSSNEGVESNSNSNHHNSKNHEDDQSNYNHLKSKHQINIVEAYDDGSDQKDLTNQQVQDKTQVNLQAIVITDHSQSTNNQHSPSQPTQHHPQQQSTAQNTPANTNERQAHEPIPTGINNNNPTHRQESPSVTIVQQTHQQQSQSQPRPQQKPQQRPQPYQPSTPQKTSSPNPRQQQKQQWSNQSIGSGSPQQQLQQQQQTIYKDSTVTVLGKQQVRQSQSPQRPRISMVKESFTMVGEEALSEQNHKASTTGGQSSIRDWFKPSPPSSIPINKTQIPTTTTTPKQSKPTTTASQQEKITLEAKEKYRRQMQAEMLGFKQTLTSHQKVNKVFGNQKEKEKQKVNKTHYQQPTSKKYLATDQQQQTTTDQYRMLIKISFQKKKENYQMLKEWDKRRAQNMNLHRNTIEMLQNQIDKRIKASLENFEIYTNFFKEKLKQQQKFTTSPVINPKYALQHNSISKNIYINCSVILNSLSQQNLAKCKKVNDFTQLIKNNVIKELTDQHLHESQRELLKVREKISTLKNSLKKYNAETEEKSEELARLFAESAGNVAIKSPSDFYTIQLDFLRCASQQILIQKRLGQNCLQYYHTALNQQFKRAKVIRQALMTYSKGLKETYNIQMEDVGLEQLSKSQEIQLIREFYQLDDMFDQRASRMLKERVGVKEHEDLTIAHLTKYVQSFEFQPFNNRMLLLKEFNSKYYSSGGTKDTKTSRQQTCYMVITVDFCIHLFFSSQKSSLNFKPDISLRILPKELEIRSQKDEFIDIVKKEEKRGSMISYFWESKNQKAYRIRFASKDAKEEFCDYVRKLMF